MFAGTFVHFCDVPVILAVRTYFHVAHLKQYVVCGKVVYLFPAWRRNRISLSCRMNHGQKIQTINNNIEKAASMGCVQIMRYLAVKT